MELITKHLRIFGRVQGVGYRAWTAQTAQHIGLKGWVRNRTDGSVEALVTGHESEIQRFITDCYEGPRLANVETISVNDGIADGEDDFRVLETS